MYTTLLVAVLSLPISEITAMLDCHCNPHSQYAIKWGNDGDLSSHMSQWQLYFNFWGYNIYWHSNTIFATLHTLFPEWYFLEGRGIMQWWAIANMVMKKIWVLKMHNISLLFKQLQACHKVHSKFLWQFSWPNSTILFETIQCTKFHHSYWSLYVTSLHISPLLSIGRGQIT